jgi:TolA-binding protein
MAATDKQNDSLQTLDKKVSTQADQIRKLQLENSVLKKSLGVNSKEQSQSKKIKQVDEAVAFSEKAIFEKFSESYQRGNKADYKKALRLLSKNYPNSKYFPDVYLLTAKSSVAKGKHKTALKAYNSVIKKYPKSDKVPAAMLGKAMIYKDLKLQKQASALLVDIQKRYPNTPEAYRASLQAKLLQEKPKAKAK